MHNRYEAYNVQNGISIALRRAACGRLETLVTDTTDLTGGPALPECDELFPPISRRDA
jgi:hypothetical protein